MFRNRKEVENHMYEACELTCHESTSKAEDIDDDDDVQEITTAIIPMKKNKVNFVCDM